MRLVDTETSKVSSPRTIKGEVRAKWESNNKKCRNTSREKNKRYILQKHSSREKYSRSNSKSNRYGTKAIYSGTGELHPGIQHRCTRNR